MMDWGSELKQTLKIKKGRRASKNDPKPDDLDTSEISKDSIPIEDISSSIKLKKTGVWGDEPNERGTKQKVNTNLIEQERFNNSTMTNSPSTPDDDIPIIPDLDDLTDDTFLNDVIQEAPIISQNRVAAYKELDIDLGKQNALASLEDLDLSLLTKCLVSEEQLHEPDEVWVWEQVFAEISSGVHSDNSAAVTSL